MTKDEAAKAWAEMHPDLQARLLDVRPKLKSYEAFLIEQKAREAVLAIYETADDAEALRQVALEAFTGLPYKKTSPFYRAPGNAA